MFPDLLENFLSALGTSFRRVSTSEHSSLWFADIASLFRKFTHPIPVIALHPPSNSDYSPPLDGAVNEQAIRLLLEGARAPARALVVIFNLGRESLSNVSFSQNWLLIDRATRQGLFSSARPRQSLSKLIRQHITIKELSPYQTKHYVQDGMFFGRDEQLDDILRWASPNFAIVGPRRIGKSSLARSVERRLRARRGQAILLTKKRYIDPVAFIDCNLLPTLKEAENYFFEAALESMGLEIRDTFHTRRIFGRTERFLGQFEFLERLTRTKYAGLTLIIDEVDGLLQEDRKSNWVLFKKIQGLIDRLGEEAKGSLSPERPAVIFSGFMELYRCLFDQSFPFFGRVKVISIGNLGREAVTRLVAEPMKEMGIKIVEPNEVINRIIYHTGGMPAVVQAVCDQAVDMLSAAGSFQMTPDLVEEIIGTQTAIETYVKWFDYISGPVEKLLVYHAAPHRRFSLATFRRQSQREPVFNVSTAELNLALEQLTFANVFREVKRHELYEFSVEAFRRIIAARMEREGDRSVLIREVFGK